MRRLLLTLTAVVATAALARPAEAQLKFGVQGALQTAVDEATSLNGTAGLGARGALQPPLLPVGLVAQGVYYFPDCSDCSYLTYSLAAQLRLTTPMVTPYAIAGWQWRRSEDMGESQTENGAMLGVGAQLNVAVAAFLEIMFEFHDEIVPDFDNDPIVIKLGILFG